jgi:hypothetical protein
VKGRCVSGATAPGSALRAGGWVVIVVGSTLSTNNELPDRIVIVQLTHTTLLEENSPVLIDMLQEDAMLQAHCVRSMMTAA